MRFPFTLYIERGDEEIALSVIYDVAPYHPATREQPEEGGDVEIISVKRDGASFTLTSSEEMALLTVCEERAQDDVAAELDAAAEWNAQCRRDDLMMERWERGA